MTKKSATFHSQIRHLRALRLDATYRQSHKQCVVMGSQLIDEIATQVSPLQRFQNEDTKLYQRITGLPNPESDLATFPLPPASSLQGCSSLLVLDQLSDPGNLGTLLRTAIALRWGGVFFITPGVDPFNDKVIRASKGALFQLPYRQGSLDELDIELQSQDWSIYAADIEGVPLQICSSVHNPILILSHEVRGLRLEVKSWVCARQGTQVTIPMHQMDSLNVAIAGGILMYYLKQRNL